MKLLSRDEIFAVDDLKFEEVPVPEWGEGNCVRVRAFTLATRAQFWKLVYSEDEQTPNTGRMAAALAVLSVVGEDGKPIFTEADIPALMDKSPAAIERIATVASRLNGLGVEAEKDAAKNSAASTS